MSTNHLASLPAEIHDYLVDFIHDDKHALGAATLAYRRWLPAARYHLFNHVSLGPNNARRFIDLLTSPLATVGAFVRRLNIEEGLGKFSFEERWLNDSLPLLKTLVGVRSLGLRNMTWEALGPQAQEDLLTGFKGVTELEIRHADAQTFTQFVEVLAAFPVLERLLFNEVEWYHNDRRRSLPPGYIQRCRRNDGFGSLQQAPRPAEVVNKRQPLKWTLAQERGPAVRSVQLSDIRAAGTQAIGRLLRGLGPALKELHIGFAGLNSTEAAGEAWAVILYVPKHRFDFSFSPVAFYRNVNLCSNTNLRTIYFDSVNLNSHRRPAERALIEVIPRILRQINGRSAHLREIVLAIWIDSIAALDGVPQHVWVEMEALLDNASLKNLCAFEVQLHGAPDRREAEDWMRGRLARYTKKGVLRMR